MRVGTQLAVVTPQPVRLSHGTTWAFHSRLDHPLQAQIAVLVLQSSIAVLFMSVGKQAIKLDGFA